MSDMNEKNSKEKIWQILKCEYPTPNEVRGWIDKYLDTHHNGMYVSEWTDIPTDGTLYSIQYIDNHFFQVFVYYRTELEQTLVVIKFKEEQYAHRAKKYHIFENMDSYVFYCEDMDRETFTEEFGHVYEEFYKICLRAEYMENFPDD